mgnify:CR=1 FL=1
MPAPGLATALPSTSERPRSCDPAVPRRGAQTGRDGRVRSGLADPRRPLPPAAGTARAERTAVPRAADGSGSSGGPQGGPPVPAAGSAQSGSREQPSSPQAPGIPRDFRGRRIVCTVPTYNEVLNIVDLCRELIALGPEVEVLVIDDNSPDGTARAVAELAAAEPRVHLLLRTSDKGRGRAGRDGFVRALEMGAQVVVEMDADFSHHPRFIPALLARLAESPAGKRRGGEPPRPYGLVLGSRAVLGGSDMDRGFVRRQVTRLANLYIRLLLGVPVKDCNSGFRCWRAETLRAIQVEQTFSKGPAIVQELLYKTARARIPISEVGIEFIDRVRGESTLTLKILMQGYTTVLKLRWMALWRRL